MSFFGFVSNAVSSVSKNSAMVIRQYWQAENTTVATDVLSDFVEDADRLLQQCGLVSLEERQGFIGSLWESCQNNSTQIASILVEKGKELVEVTKTCLSEPLFCQQLQHPVSSGTPWYVIPIVFGVGVMAIAVGIGVCYKCRPQVIDEERLRLNSYYI